MNIQGKKFKYNSVRDQILKAIVERNLEEGSRLPSEADLCSMLRAARNTIRTALDSLASEGIVEKRKGHPCVIRRVMSLPPPRKIAWLNAGPGTMLDNIVYSEIFRALAEEVPRRNLKMDILFIHSEDMLETFLPRLRDYTGLIFNSTCDAAFNDSIIRALPGKLVIVDFFKHSLPCSMVRTDSYAGTREIMQYLIDSGHRRIVFLQVGTTRDNYLPFRERFQAYSDVLRENGLEEIQLFSKETVDFMDLTSYLRRHQDILRSCDAVFTIGDMIGIMALSSLPLLGFRVPEDISVASFDGIALSEFSSPPLTTMRQPIEKIAADLIDVILDQDAGDISSPVEKKLLPELIRRESVRVGNKTIGKGMD